MKITIMCTYFYPYGETKEKIDPTYLASSAPELARYLVSNGNEVVVISRRVPGTKAKIVSRGIKIIRVPFSKNPGLRLLTWRNNARKALKKSEREKKSDVILCWDWSATLPALKLGVPVICSVRNSSETWRNKGRLVENAYRVLENQAFNKSDLVVYSSKWVKRTVDSVFNIKTKTKVLHHGIDTTMFKPSITSKPIRNKYKLKSPVIGFFGRLDTVKGLDYLIDACSEIKEPFTLFFVGDGPLKKYLKEKCQKKMPGKYVFAGFQNRNLIPKYMAACDIIVLPSLEEGFSSVVVEALAMGKPFIGTKVGGVPEVLDGKNGIKIPPKNTGALKAALESLLKSPAKRRVIGKRARSFAVKKYSWPIIVKEWEKLLRSVV